MYYFTTLFEGFCKAPQTGTAPPQASSESASTYRPDTVHVSPEQPVAPEVSPPGAPSVPADVGE
jgi:hypothetical protein